MKTIKEVNFGKKSVVLIENSNGLYSSIIHDMDEQQWTLPTQDLKTAMYLFDYFVQKIEGEPLQ